MSASFRQSTVDIRASINYLFGHNHDARYFRIGEKIVIDDIQFNVGLASGSILENITDTAYSNVVIGPNAGRGITSGSYNVAIGQSPLGEYSTPDITGTANNAIGYRAGYYMTSGGYNTVFGETSPTTGSYNFLANKYAGYLLEGDHNIAIGYNSLKYDGTSNFITGDHNLAFGHSALGKAKLTANNNIALGQFAGYYSNAAKTTFMGEVNNTICIGQEAYATASGEMALGNSTHITAAYTAAAFSTRSDERYKNFLGMDIGLDFINSLVPEKYTWKDGIDKTTIHYGFSAQKVKSSLFAFADNENRAMHRQRGDEQNLTYTEFIAPLVKAVQELSLQNTELLKRIEALEA